MRLATVLGSKLMRYMNILIIIIIIKIIIMLLIIICTIVILLTVSRGISMCGHYKYPIINKYIYIYMYIHIYICIYIYTYIYTSRRREEIGIMRAKRA